MGEYGKLGIRKSCGLVAWNHGKGRRISTLGQMNCHVAWMERIVAFGDFLCETLVGSVRGQRRQRVLETPNRLTSILKESLADPWCDRLRTHKCPVSPESRSRDGCCSIVVLEVKNAGEDDSEGGEKDNKK